MLTIKHIDPQHCETVFLAKSVTLNPPSESTEDQRFSVLYGTDGASGAIWDGLIYVMNDMGKTVSRWELTPLQPMQSNHPSVRG